MPRGDQPTSLGMRLQKAREARGIGVADVARHLRLDVKVITALEQDDYAVLPPAAFVCGYLRGYARLFDLSAETLIAEYQALTQSSPPTLKVVGPPRIPVSHRPPTPKAVYLWGAGLVLVLSAAAGWWYFERGGVLMVGNQAQQPTEAAPVSNEVTDEAASMSSPPTAVVPPAPLPVGEASLTLEISASSWVSIQDATGRFLVREQLPAGARRDIHGKPPLRVLLGNSPGVRLTYNGQMVDISLYTRQQVAHFTLGDNEGKPHAPP